MTLNPLLLNSRPFKIWDPAVGIKTVYGFGGTFCIKANSILEKLGIIYFSSIALISL